MASQHCQQSQQQARAQHRRLAYDGLYVLKTFTSFVRRLLTRVGGLTSAIEYLYEVNLYELILETHIRYGAPVSCGNVRGSKS